MNLSTSKFHANLLTSTSSAMTNLIGKLIISAVLKLKAMTNGYAKGLVKEELEIRKKTQPLGTKNVGSVFRNPQDNHAGRLIEEVGLKGKKVGRVRFSPKHDGILWPILFPQLYSSLCTILSKPVRKSNLGD